MSVVIPELQVPSSQEQILPDTIPQKFHSTLNSGQTTEAFKICSAHAENLLCEVARRQGHSCQPHKQQRGVAKFSDTRTHPKIINGQASTLQDRKIWKALCRAKEVQLAAPGHCRDNTWEKLPEVLSHIPQENRLQAENLLSQQPSQDDLSQLIALLQQIVSKISCLDRIARLNRWKKQLRSSEQSTAKWLKSRNKKAYPCCWYNRSR